MSSVRAEYLRFLASLAVQDVHENVRKMANLVLAHLPHLAEVGTQRRARSARLATLAIEHLASTSAESPQHEGDALGDRASVRLERLEVGPFRGFMQAEVFNLSHDITLVYGANGTGKSSFCEALELAMLGSISEAGAKRFDQRAYCNNARLRRHVPPRLYATSDGAAASLLEANEENYRFCFVEKNRLDDFGRIAARTPGDQRQLIATLFGVDQFSEFVRGFNPSLDENLSLASVKAIELDGRRAQLAASQQIIQNHDQRLALLGQQEDGLAARIHAGSTYQACCDWLLGTPQQLGRLAYIQRYLDAPSPVIHGCTAALCEARLAEVYQYHEDVLAAERQLATRSGEVSYSKLYEAVLELSEGASACPACGTELDRVGHNPFARARAGLEQLAELKALEEHASAARERLSESLRQLLGEMRRVISVASICCQEQLGASQLPALPEVSIGQWLQPWVGDDRSAWQRLVALAQAVEQVDVASRQTVELRDSFAQERDRLDRFKTEIERCQLLRVQALDEFARAQATVAQFNQDNQQLIGEVAQEALGIAPREAIKAAYDGFLPLLQAYLAGLPTQLVQGLGESVRDLYNSFNREDPEPARIHALRLPLAENGRIEIEFSGNPGVGFDALMILSEGHIRCLGLAILLAKNIAERCPIVIFDDVVNAIDDEHRDGIWRTFFESGLLDGKQVILTSHAEEFLHRIQQELGAARAANIRRYKFLPHQGGHHLRIDTDPPTKNYVLLAQTAVDAEEKRDALRHSRAALESLTDRIWTWMGRRHDGRLELMLAGPRANWELNNKCIKLRRALGRMPNPPEAVGAIQRGLDDLLNVSGASIEWSYLNGGTHDSQRDHEFDRAAVRTIVTAAVAMDGALDTLQRG